MSKKTSHRRAVPSLDPVTTRLPSIADQKDVLEHMPDAPKRFALFGTLAAAVGLAVMRVRATKVSSTMSAAGIHVPGGSHGARFKRPWTNP